LYSDRAVGPVAIFGRVAAQRALSYDYKVEWGAGVEPDEKDFHSLVAEVRNVPATAVTGGPTQPLGSFDPRELDPHHAIDPDSPPQPMPIWGAMAKRRSSSPRIPEPHTAWSLRAEATRGGNSAFRSFPRARSTSRKRTLSHVWMHYTDSRAVRSEVRCWWIR